MKRIITFIKESRRNQNNEDQIEKYNTINLDWKIRLKLIKLLQKIEIKIRNQKIKKKKYKNIKFNKLGLKNKIENK